MLSQFLSHFHSDFMSLRVGVGVGVTVKTDEFKPIFAIKCNGIFVAYSVIIFDLLY